MTMEHHFIIVTVIYTISTIVFVFYVGALKDSYTDMRKIFDLLRHRIINIENILSKALNEEKEENKNDLD